jgi:hypothetical protein
MYQRIQRARDSEKRARTREHVFDEAIWRLGGWNERKESRKQGIALLKRAMKMGHPGKPEKEKKKGVSQLFFFFLLIFFQRRGMYGADGRAG